MIHAAESSRWHLLLGGAALTAAVVLQVASGTPLWAEFGPLSIAQALLLGLLSAPCALIARSFRGSGKGRLLWGTGAATLATVAVVQLALLMLGALPEGPAYEYPSMLAWGAAAAILFLSRRVGQPLRGRSFVLAGFALQSVALTADFVDGGGLGLDLVSLRLLGAAEELIEMLALVCYLAGLTRFATESHPRLQGAHAGGAVTGAPTRWQAFAPARVPRMRELAPFENWPPLLFYAPVAGYVVWRGLASGGIALPAAVNPRLARDGILNVSKSAIFEALSPAARRWLPPYLMVERRQGEGADALAEALAGMERAGVGFPVVAKPDRGGRGAGVKLLRDEAELRAHLALIPISVPFLLQQYIPLEHEAGVMYVRQPGASEGRIVSLALKEAPFVVGDGTRTLRALVEAHPRARHHRAMALRENRAALDHVLARGERRDLVFARNHCRGAVFRDGSDLVTAALERRLDEIARSIPSFHLGRFDIRFASIPRLQEGEDFRVIEVNGAVSEPIHAWDPGNTVGQAWRCYFEQIDRLYEVSTASVALGHRGPNLAALIGGWWRLRRISRSYPGEG